MIQIFIQQHPENKVGNAEKQKREYILVKGLNNCVDMPYSIQSVHIPSTTCKYAILVDSL